MSKVLHPVSIIIPTLNEGAVIVGLLKRFQALRALGCQVIVSDGGSTDNTCELVEHLVDRLVRGDAGRARQMNRGAAEAEGEILWFIHADSDFQQPALGQLVETLADADCTWGRFNVQLDARPFVYRVIESLINWRSRVTGIATGDQAIFVRRKVFEMIHGFADLPLMEDVDISQRLRAIARPLCISTPVITSARRWQQGGVIRTILLMWRLRLAFYLGVSPERLARHYHLCSSPTRVS